jgi:hypothetical protein
MMCVATIRGLLHMSYLVTCTFDLKNASIRDYENAYSDLARIGLKKTVAADRGGEVIAPTTMTIGQFNGQSAAVVRDQVRNAVKQAFFARHLSSEIFVVVGGDWTWGAAAT